MVAPFLECCAEFTDMHEMSADGVRTWEVDCAALVASICQRVDGAQEGYAVRGSWQAHEATVALRLHAVLQGDRGSKCGANVVR